MRTRLATACVLGALLIAGCGDQDEPAPPGPNGTSSSALDEDELAEVGAAVAAAELDEQPPVIDEGDGDVTDTPIDEFGYGDAEVRVVTLQERNELVELSELLVDLFRDNNPEG